MALESAKENSPMPVWVNDGPFPTPHEIQGSVVLKESHVIHSREANGFQHVYPRSGVSVIMITAEGKFRFIQEKRAGNDGYMVKPVTAFIDDNETAFECAKRELKEETGCETQTWVPIQRSENTEEAVVHKRQYYFIAKDVRKVHEVQHDSDETISHELVDLSAEEVHERALRGEFGTTQTGFILLVLAEKILRKKSLSHATASPYVDVPIVRAW